MSNDSKRIRLEGHYQLREDKHGEYLTLERLIQTSPGEATWTPIATVPHDAPRTVKITQVGNPPIRQGS